MSDSLEFDIIERPDFALLVVRLKDGQKVLAEPSAMATMTPNIELKAGFKGGIGATIGRALGGESLIINTFTCKGGPGEISFAAGQMGDTVHYRLNGNRIMLQRGAFVAMSEGVEVTGKWQGARGFFSGEGLVLLQASGNGDLFFNSYGAILEVNLTGADYYVDTGYIVAFEETVSYSVTTLPGLSRGGAIKSFLFGGEGLVCKFSGQGKVWIQTRAVNPMLSWVYPFRPVQRQNQG